MPLNIKLTFLFVFSNSLLIAVTGELQPGTTRNARDIFLGRCFEFQQLKSHNSPEIQKKNCTHLFYLFANTVDLKNTCKGNYSTIFDNFFKEIDPGLTAKNKALFWSGTLVIAHDLSFVDPNFVTLEDTFPGFIVNGINFCAGNKPYFFNFTACKCPWSNNVGNLFWHGASKQFAKNAQGIVHVFLNGTRKDGAPAYRKSSFFGSVELPNMNPSLVKEIKILVGWDLNVKPKETCNSESLQKLKKDIKNRNIAVSCEDNPRAVFHILCAKNSTSPACKVMQESIKRESRKWKYVGIALAALAGILLVSLAIAVTKIFRDRQIVFKKFDVKA